MASKWIGIFALGVATLVVPPSAFGGEEALKKELAKINVLTGKGPMQGALNALVSDKDHAKKLLDFGLTAAKSKQLSYNGAYVLGLTAAKMKDMKTAETYLRVCMDQGAKLQSLDRLAQSYGLLIEKYFLYKQYKDAARICKELLELNTDDGKEREVIGLTDRNQLGDPNDRFDPARGLRHGVFEYYVQAIAKLGKYDQALKLVDGAIKRTDDWRDLKLKGWVLKEAGKLEDAAAAYEDVIKRIPKDVRFKKESRNDFLTRTHYELSNVYIELKKIDRATEHLELLLKSNPDNPIFYNDLGYVWADNDMKLEEAEKLIRKALELDRERRKMSEDFNPKTDHDSGTYLDSLGWVLFKQKKNAEAKVQLLKAVEDKSAQSIEIYDHLGDVEFALGERDAAQKAWQKGVEVATDSRRDQERKAIVEKKLGKAKDTK
jgi:tetratricopeptide (TPR) repeat protein